LIVLNLRFELQQTRPESSLTFSSAKTRTRFASKGVRSAHNWFATFHICDHPLRALLVSLVVLLVTPILFFFTVVLCVVQVITTRAFVLLVLQLFKSSANRLWQSPTPPMHPSDLTIRAKTVGKTATSATIERNDKIRRTHSTVLITRHLQLHRLILPWLTQTPLWHTLLK
jgi:hypothetical protein